MRTLVDLSSQVVSMIRIGIAAGCGFLLTRLAEVAPGLDVDGEALVSFTTALGISIYYALARYVENRWPRLKVLGLANPEV